MKPELDQILNQYSPDQLRLPYLKESSSWFHELWQETLAAIQAFLQGFNSPIDLNFNFLLGDEFLVVVGYVFCSTVVVLVGYTIVKWLMAARRLTPLKFESQTPDDRQLGTKLDLAKESGNWSLALRLLWLMFLVRSMSSLSTTPQEYFLPNESINPKQIPDWFDRLYSGMFSTSADSDFFEQMAKELHSRERQ